MAIPAAATASPQPNDLSGIAPGVYPQTPMDVYHTWRAASNSRLSRLRQSPAHLKAYMDAPPKDTDALFLGKAIHTAILEPHELDLRYMVAEQCVGVKKDGERCSNMGVMLDQSVGWICGVHKRTGTGDIDLRRTVVKPDELALCRGIRASIEASRSARALLTGEGEMEFSIVWNDSVTGVRCKGRLDRHSPKIAGGAIIDIKSTRDASPRAFERSIFDNGYHRQAAMYLDGTHVLGIPAEHFVIVAVEKEPPYAVGVYRLTDGAIEAGRQQITPLLRQYADCVAKNRWPAYPDKVVDIALPPWAWQVVDDEVKAAERGTNYDTSE